MFPPAINFLATHEGISFFPRLIGGRADITAPSFRDGQAVTGLLACAAEDGELLVESFVIDLLTQFFCLGLFFSFFDSLPVDGFFTLPHDFVFRSCFLSSRIRMSSVSSLVYVSFVLFFLPTS